MKRIPPYLLFLTCLILICTVAVRRDGTLLGHPLTAEATPQESSVTYTAPVTTDTLCFLDDGTLQVTTKPLSTDVIGFAGPVPLQISIKDNHIADIQVMDNDETPSFLERAQTLLDAWKGKSIEEAETLEVDVVSGATFTSRALIENVRLGVAYATQHDAREPESLPFSGKDICTLAVILVGMIVPLFVKNNPRYHITQLIFNVIVLGLWSGTFLSYSLILGVVSHGLDVTTGYLPLLLLITAFIFPLFGKKSHYCSHLCPLGSAQSLMGKLPVRKPRLSPRLAQFLQRMGQAIWVVLMLLMLAGVCFEWMDYEPFTAFIFQSAPWFVIAFAVVILLTSLFVPRAYCRFMCPTGTLMKVAQK